ncbi:MAG: N-acetylmuramidase domain-containing protein [Salipiger marinus]|uniref:N-acetylmuramidase domain-containing protein n=1 Tax=Salipiger marinus TaxID=555512 RepID=UPI004058AC4B
MAYPKWGERPYPVSADARYALFARMAAIDERAAIRSCSWGLPQMMGFNASLCGYDTGRAMVEDFAQDEEHQLDAMVTFIVAAGLDDELRRHDWRGFARGYNGPGYATHGYHTRLADRFRWWQGKPDTPWSPGMCGVASVQVEDLNRVLVA